MTDVQSSNPIIIYLCDDQKEHIKQICDTFEGLSKEYMIQIESFVSPDKLLEQLKKAEKEKCSLPDFVLLDIEMPEIDGISLGKEIKQCFPDIYLVFVTAYEEYAIAGYEADAFRYLLKPVTESKLLKLLDDYKKEQNKKKRITIKSRKEECTLLLSDIIYISAEDKYTVIYTTNQHYISDNSLNSYEERLVSFGFFRIHRKYLVNMYHHRAINGNNILLSGEVSLPISKRKMATYRSSLFSGLKEDLI